MAIDIKEIFVTDLDAGNSSWWSQHKLDKINYNFELLSNGGMPGPTGTQGPAGNHGSIGLAGTQGFQGPIGELGHQGASGLSYWRSVITTPNYENIMPIQNSQYGPNGIKSGLIDAAALNNPYNTPIEYYTGNPVNIHTDKVNFYRRHIDLLVDEEYVGSIDLYRDGVPTILALGKIDPTVDLDIELEFEATTSKFLNHPVNESSSVRIEESEVVVDGTSTVNGETNLKDTYFVPGADTNKILVSTNTDGDVEWRNKFDIFNSFPVGSIIRIPAFQFNSDNFHLEETIQQYAPDATPSYPVLANTYGRGKEGSQFEGWYLCHGLTWYYGATQWEVPNLNSFEYAIDTNNPTADPVNDIFQNATDNLGSTNQIIISGADIEMNASNSALLTYDVSLTTDTTNETVATSTGTSYDLTRMIHVVYLQDTNLVWSVSSNEPEISEYEIMLDLSSEHCAYPTSVDSFILTPWSSSNNWSTANMSGVTLWLTNGSGEKTLTANTGWYSLSDGSSTISRYWLKTGNATGVFQQSFDCSSINTANLAYSEFVSSLNGTPSSLVATNTYTLSSSSTFSTTSTLQLNGSNAPSGWYRDIVTGSRRYWNGSTFRGYEFTRNYVEIVLDGVGYTSSLYPCVQYDEWVTFIETHTGIDTVNNIQELYDYDSALFTNLTPSNILNDGSQPLDRVKDTAIGQYITKVHLYTRVASINSSSKIDIATVQTCTGSGNQE